MDTVNFITTETGDDLILSFSFDEGTCFDVDGFIIQRTPKFELILRPDERGPSVDWTDDDERILIRKIKVTPREVFIETTRDKHIFDLSKISGEEYADMVSVLKKMNFDNVFDLKIERRS